MSPRPRGIILAAGRGMRMGALTEEVPKCLLVAGGRRLLDWQLGSMRAAGILEIAIVTGYKAELLANEGTEQFHNDMWNSSDMVSSLKYASEWLENGPCIVSYSDIYYNPSAIAGLLSSTADLAVTYDPDWLHLWKRRFADPLSDAESFRLQRDGYLAEIGRKVDSVELIEGQYMGLTKFSAAGWATFADTVNMFPTASSATLQMTAVLQRIVELNFIPIEAVAYTGAWGEIDSASDLDLLGAG